MYSILQVTRVALYSNLHVKLLHNLSRKLNILTLCSSQIPVQSDTQYNHCVHYNVCHVNAKRQYSVKPKPCDNNLQDIVKKSDDDKSVDTSDINNDNTQSSLSRWKLILGPKNVTKNENNINDKIKDTNKSNKHLINNDNKIVTDDSSQLKLLNATDEEWKAVEPLNTGSLLRYYGRLGKLRLTSLVVITTLSGYYMAINGPIDPLLLTFTLFGTGLTSASATALNQYLEIPYDSQMIRTRNRPLVISQLSSLHAIGYASVCGTLGLSLLLYVNPLTAVLGAVNLVLYSFIYTPMKRAHIANTWVGAIVGAIPPVMGFTAATNTIDLSALLLGLILYSWQFPHFNALSWNMRHDYARAGYRMMSVTEPALCVNTSLRHSALLLIYSTLMCTCLTTWTFACDSLPFNLYLIYLSYEFRKNPNAQTSRKLFRYSLIHLPAIIMLMLISKRRKNNDKNDNNNVIELIPVNSELL